MLPAQTFAACLRIASLNLYNLKPTLKMVGEADTLSFEMESIKLTQKIT